ncbi:MAG: hypothetical protein WAL36_00760, partial [Pseudolabrys sp.]
AGCSICQITFYEFEVAICPHYVRFSVNSARCPEPEPRALIRQSLGYTRRQLPTILAIARHKQRDSSASPHKLHGLGVKLRVANLGLLKP